MPIEDVSLRELLIVETMQADLDALVARCERLREKCERIAEFVRAWDEQGRVSLNDEASWAEATERLFIARRRLLPDDIAPPEEDAAE